VQHILPQLEGTEGKAHLDPTRESGDGGVGPVDAPVRADGFHCGAMAGALKKKPGLGVASEKVEGRGRVYFLYH